LHFLLRPACVSFIFLIRCFLSATPDTPNLERRTVAAPSQTASHQQQQNPIFKHLKLIKKIEAQNVKSIKQLASPYSPSVHHTLHMYDATITGEQTPTRPVRCVFRRRR